VLVFPLAACSQLGPDDAVFKDAANAYMSAQEFLLSIDPAPQLSPQQEALLSTIRSRRTSAEVHVARLASAPASMLQVGLRLGLAVAPGKVFVASGERVSQRTPTDISWAGPLHAQEGWATLVLTARGVTGTLRSGSALHTFEPLGGGLEAIVRVDENKFPPEEPPSLDASPSVPGFQTPPPGAGINGVPLWPEPSTGTPSCQPYQDPPCIDVMVVYTPAAAGAVGDMAGLIQTAVDETNQSYANSSINASVRLVHEEQVDYSEVGHTYPDHVNLLQGTTDGVMDNVHALRNQYLADVVVLVVYDATACGYASTILAQRTTAFAAVDYSCATGHYSFGHEIGHLQGARHDRFVDATGTPFQDGHGYVDPANYQWRTIMAYDDACEFYAGHTCTRVQYWSNPEVPYPPTGQAMGTTTYENDARVVEQTAIILRQFYTIPSPSGFTITNWYTTGEMPDLTWDAVSGAQYYHVYACDATTDVFGCDRFDTGADGYQTAVVTGTEYQDYFSGTTTGHSGCFDGGDQWYYYVTAENGTGESPRVANWAAACLNGGFKMAATSKARLPSLRRPVDVRGR